MASRKHGRYEAATAAAIGAAEHLKDRPEYGALIEAALGYARAVDEAYGRSAEAGGKAMGWVGPHWVHALRALGLSPDSVAVAPVPARGRLAELRAARAAGSTHGEDQ